MVFSEIMTDDVVIYNENQCEIKKIKASVQKNIIYINNIDIVINPEFIIERRLSNGGVEKYRVINPHYREKFHDIPPGYQIEVEKIGIPKTSTQNTTSANFHISGGNTKIYQNSQDNSTTVYNYNDIDGNLNALRNEIDKLNFSIDEKNENHEIINAVEEEIKSSTPRKSIVKTLLAGLPKIESISNVVTNLSSMF